MVRKEFSSSKTTIRHEIHTSRGIPRPAMDLVIDAADMVWRKHFPGTPTIMKHVFVSQAPELAENDEFPLGYYNPEDGAMSYAYGTIKSESENGISSLTEEQWLALVGGHEAAHKVQDQKGWFRNPLYDELAYSERPYEMHAFSEGLHVAKKLFPNLQGSLYVENRRFKVPKKSKYE